MNTAINLSENIRTNCAERLLRTISLSEIHNKLMAIFVDRLELQDKLMEKSRQNWFDSCLIFGNDYHKQQNCWLMHRDWQEFERMAIKEHWQDLFIEDEKGGNNAW